jgi:hypothetical protein
MLLGFAAVAGEYDLVRRGANESRDYAIRIALSESEGKAQSVVKPLSAVRADRSVSADLHVVSLKGRDELLAENTPPVLEFRFIDLATRKALLENIEWRPGRWQLVWRIYPRPWAT